MYIPNKSTSSCMNQTFKVTVFKQPYKQLLLQHFFLKIYFSSCDIFKHFQGFARPLNSLYYSKGEKHKYQHFIVELPTL